MVIQHNMNAMNASRQLGLVTGGLAKSSEKLSSGYRINRAADDAAGLSISEKMRRQIRGLDRASENIEDGISLCQVADGALNETVDILQRMRELAVQSANGTNSVSDRRSIEMEITQLKSEVDRIAETTKFNDAVYPLNAPITHSESEIIEISSVTEAPPENDTKEGLIRETTVTFKTSVSCIYDGKQYMVGDTITIEGLTTNDKEIWCSNDARAVFASGSWVLSSANNFGPLKISDLKFDNDGYIYYLDDAGTAMYAGYETGTSTTPDPLWFNIKSGVASISWGRFMTAADLGSQKPGTSQETKNTITMQVTNYYFSSNESTSVHSGDSSSQTNKIQVRTVNATCKGLGISDMTAATQDSAAVALVLLDRAIAKASSYRSAFGAAQNRLEHAQKIDDNTAENTQAAESQIRDTDMAAEMVKHSNAGILMQAGQSMLAQANQSTQSVLSLVA